MQQLFQAPSLKPSCTDTGVLCRTELIFLGSCSEQAASTWDCSLVLSWEDAKETGQERLLLLLLSLSPFSLLPSIFKLSKGQYLNTNVVSQVYTQPVQEGLALVDGQKGTCVSAYVCLYNRCHSCIPTAERFFFIEHNLLFFCSCCVCEEFYFLHT